MKHLSIEGMDGAGKTTTCKLLSQKLGFTFVEKPLHLLFDKTPDRIEEYIRIRDQVNANPNRDFTSWFYGLGSLYMYEKYQNENIVTDRHLASNYAWSGTENNKDVYQLLLKKLGKPQLTVILKVSEEAILARLKKRDPEDSDINKVHKSTMICSRMIEFCEEYELPYMVVDSSVLTPEEVVKKIIEKWNAICAE